VVQLPVLFDLKPVIIRAFTAAKTKLKAKTKYGDDYVSLAEFRYLLSYLRQYYEYWVAFSRIDKDGDKRVTINEFRQAVPIIAKWGIKVDNPEATFREIDKDKGGLILFAEFCSWAIKKNLDLDDDDDAEMLK
jgi:Ca2+-binding EF-hand superfamily protein